MKLRQGMAGKWDSEQSGRESDGSKQSAKKGQMDRVQSSNTRHRPSDEILNGGNCDEVSVQIALDLTLTQRKASEE